MLAGEGLYPSSHGAQIACSGGKASVIDGPFAEAKELIAEVLADSGQVARGGHRVGAAGAGAAGARRDRAGCVAGVRRLRRTGRLDAGRGA